MGIGTRMDRGGGFSRHDLEVFLGVTHKTIYSCMRALGIKPATRSTPLTPAQARAIMFYYYSNCHKRGWSSTRMNIAPRTGHKHKWRKK